MVDQISRREGHRLDSTLPAEHRSVDPKCKASALDLMRKLGLQAEANGCRVGVSRVPHPDGPCKQRRSAAMQ